MVDEIFSHKYFFRVSNKVSYFVIKQLFLYKYGIIAYNHSDSILFIFYYNYNISKILCKFGKNITYTSV